MNQIQANECADDELLELRTVDSLSIRYRKHIQPDFTKFMALKRANKMDSGENDEVYLERLLDLFRWKFGRPFKYKKCIPILEEGIVKFSPSKDYSEVVGMTEESDSGVMTVVPSMICPAGSKLSNKRQKFDEMLQKNTQGADDRVSAVVDSIKEVKDALGNKLEFKKFKQQLDFLENKRKFLVTIGDLDGAKKVTEEMQVVNDSKQPAKQTISTNVDDVEVDDNSETDDEMLKTDGPSSTV